MCELTVTMYQHGGSYIKNARLFFMPTTPLCPSLTLFIIMTLFHDYFLYSAYASLHEAASTSSFIFRAYLVSICGILWQSFLYVIANSFQLTYSANNFDVSILSHCSAISSFAWLCFLCAHYFHCEYFFLEMTDVT